MPLRRLSEILDVNQTPFYLQFNDEWILLESVQRIGKSQRSTRFMSIIIFYRYDGEFSRQHPKFILLHTFL